MHGFKCDISNAKCSFTYINSMFGRIDRAAFADAIVLLLKLVCLPFVLYGIDDIPVSAADI